MAVEVLYNGSCPICAAEIAAYRRAAEGRDMRFVDLGAGDLAAWGLSEAAAARRLHVRQDGRIVSGLEAFRAIWAELPRWRWLAWATGLPGVRAVVGLLYDRVLAPALYAAHRRRQRADRLRRTG